MRNCSILLVMAATAAAQPVLKLDDLIAEALRANPEIQAALPDPMLPVGYTSGGKRKLRGDQTRHSVDKGAQRKIFKAQTPRSVLETRILQVERERGSREEEINMLSGCDPLARLGTPIEIAPGTLTVTLDEPFRRAAFAYLALQRELKMMEHTELAVNLARETYYPDYPLSAGYFNVGRTPAYFRCKQQNSVAE